MGVTGLGVAGVAVAREVSSAIINDIALCRIFGNLTRGRSSKVTNNNSSRERKAQY